MPDHLDVGSIMGEAVPVQPPQTVVDAVPDMDLPPCETGEDPEAVDRECARYELTDHGNAMRMVRRYGPVIRYSWVHESWMVWRGSHWSRDRVGMVYRYAMAAIARIHQEAAYPGSTNEPGDYHQHCRHSQSMTRTNHMITAARMLPGITVEDPTTWDAHPHLLATPNGTVDLRTGRLRAPDRADMLTRCTPDTYDPKATHPKLTKLLRDLTAGDGDFETYLRDLFGYTIAAENREKLFIVCCGVADTGKSTLLEAVKAALGGELCATTPIETFMRQTSSQIRTDIARLDGQRMVISSESEKGQRFAGGLIKLITGRGTVSARHLFASFFEFRAKFAPWMDTNDMPYADWADTGMRSRILVLPFLNPIAQRDQDSTIQEELWGTPAGRRAVLAWVVAGAKAYLQRDTPIKTDRPKLVDQAVDSYWQDQDPIADFADELQFVADPDAYLTAKDVRDAYLDWAEGRGRKPVTEKTLGDWLRKQGGTKQRKRVNGKPAVIWTGVQFHDGTTSESDGVTVTDVTGTSQESLDLSKTYTGARARAPAPARGDSFLATSEKKGNTGNIGNGNAEPPSSPPADAPPPRRLDGDPEDLAEW